MRGRGLKPWKSQARAPLPASPPVRWRVGFELNRRDLARLLWQLWSPNWRFAAETFETTAASFDDPDFVAGDGPVVPSSVWQRAGDPALETFQERLAGRLTIAAPTSVLQGACDGVGPPEQSERHAQYFTGRYERQVIPVADHFLSRECPDAVVAAVRSLLV